MSDPTPEHEAEFQANKAKTIAELERLLGACLAAMVITQNKGIPADWTSMIEAIDKTLRP